MRLLAHLLLPLLLLGCSSVRPTQGFHPSCGLYAIADVAEIQFRKPIPREDRERAWAKTWKGPHGTILNAAFDSARKAGWIPNGSRLHVCPLTDIDKSPLIANMAGHAIVLLSVTPWQVIYLDPTCEEPQWMTVKDLEQKANGFYWRIVTP